MAWAATAYPDWLGSSTISSRRCRRRPGAGSTPTMRLLRHLRSAASSFLVSISLTSDRVGVITHQHGCLQPWLTCSMFRAGYFLDSTVEERVNDELEALAALKDGRVRSLMLRAQGVSAESMEHLGAILDRIRQLEGLDSHIDNEPE